MKEISYCSIQKVLKGEGHLSNVIEINRKSVFTLVEANALLRIIYRLSEESELEVRSYTNRLKAYSEDKSNAIAIELEAKINIVISRWQSKLERLGAEPKGLWMADFDNGHGYFCWKYPEKIISHHHGYQDGFSGRIVLE